VRPAEEIRRDFLLDPDVAYRMLVRLSVQAYNTEEDADRLVTALTENIPRNAKSR
jgi:selenocysteine lyase/cysteine desulfurase